MQATRHTLEVTARPYSPGQPRLYHAADYSLGDVVINSGITYEVQDIGGVSMFVSLRDGT